MMRMKLVGAKRASFKGAANVVLKGQTVDVDDATGAHLKQQFNRDALNNPHPIWEVVSTTAGDSAATLDPEEVEEEVEEDVEEELEGEEAVEEKAPAAPRRRTPPKKKGTAKAATATARARAKSAT